MSEETSEQVVAAPSDDTSATSADAAVIGDVKKSVKFEANELTFDEAQAEIDAIKARAGQARENLKAVPAATSTYTSSYSSSTPSSSTLDDEVPKSKNMLSHLNSSSAMLNYKVTTARNLVQKQEALLRNLKMMRENMERSSIEISRASDYLSPVRAPPRGYFEKRAESAPIISRRQVCEVSPVVSPICNLEATERISEKAYSPPPISISSHVSTLPAPISSTDYQPDEDFEKEMAALRKRVSNLTKQANEVPTPRYSSYDYDSGLTSNCVGGYTDIYPKLEPKIEVKNVRTHKYTPKTHHSSLPPKTVYTSQHASVDNDISSTYPRNSYTDYLLETVNNLDTYPTNTSLDLYADPLATTVADYPIAY